MLTRCKNPPGHFTISTKEHFAILIPPPPPPPPPPSEPLHTYPQPFLFPAGAATPHPAHATDADANVSTATAAAGLRAAFPGRAVPVSDGAGTHAHRMALRLRGFAMLLSCVAHTFFGVADFQRFPHAMLFWFLALFMDPKHLHHDLCWHTLETRRNLSWVVGHSPTSTCTRSPRTITHLPPFSVQLSFSPHKSYNPDYSSNTNDPLCRQGLPRPVPQSSQAAEEHPSLVPPFRGRSVGRLVLRRDPPPQAQEQRPSSVVAAAVAAREAMAHGTASGHSPPALPKVVKISRCQR